jgi:hypothetical protein
MTQRWRDAFAVSTDGGPLVFPAGRLVSDDDPILRTHGHLFEAVEVQVQRQESASRSVTAVAVETASAAPGEVRQVVSVAPDGGRQSSGSRLRPGRRDGEK